MKQLNNLPKVTQTWILTPGQREHICFSCQELGRGGKDNRSCENLLGSNPGHERLEWEILILFGSNYGLLFSFFLSDAGGQPVGTEAVWPYPDTTF